jgi:serine/threonine protein phosphatase PrpC
MKHFSFSCQGASHIASEKPCQDSSASSSEDGVSIIVVADGHGGERYFRSDIGSKICTEVTINAIKQFITLSDTSIFHGSPFTQVSSIIGENSLGKLNDVDNALRRLFASIILAWNQEIEKYTLENPPTDIEVEKVAPEYIKSLSQGIALEKIYGCTLMAYVQTPEFWFAFHLGDGKCVSFHQGESSLWMEPIPWDEKCFLNKTTSICDSEALDEFRYCYQGNGHYPAAIFLGSDGMDDSFGPIENLVDFYMQVIKLLAKDEDAAIKSIIETLPVLSKRGSQDDMSVAFIFHRDAIDNMLPAIITSQIESIEKQINDIGNKMNDLQAKLESITGATDNKSEIERNYASSDIERCKASLDRLNNKLNIRKQELAELNSSIGSSEV